MISVRVFVGMLLVFFQQSHPWPRSSLSFKPRNDPRVFGGMGDIFPWGNPSPTILKEKNKDNFNVMYKFCVSLNVIFTAWTT